MLFFVLIGVCLSINQDSLQPLKSETPSTLISIAKTDPHALVSMLDGADPAAIDQIVTILNEIIDEGNQEIDTLNKSVAEATGELNTLNTELDSKVKEQGEAKQEYETLSSQESAVRGRLASAQSALDLAKPDLDNEIDTLEKVEGILQTLLASNTPESQSLIEMGSSEKGRAYLKLIAKVQANPDKIAVVIGYIQTLLQHANEELEQLENTVTDLEQAVEAAESLTQTASAKYQTAQETVVTWTNKVTEASSALDTASDIFETRKAAIDDENATLRNVIDLLNSTKDEE